MALFGPLTPVVEEHPDGVVYVRTAEPLPPFAKSWINRLEHWAETAPDRTFLAERDGESWRTLSYRDALDKTMRIGSWLLAHGASAERPLLILSGNSIAHGLLSLAGMAVGAPTCPVSTAYSLISQDLSKLKGVIDLMTPSFVFAEDAVAYARALELARGRGIGLSEPSRPVCVALSLRGLVMLAAIDLDDETPLQADKIDDVRTDGMLAAETRAQLVVANARPEDPLGIRCLAS